MYTAQIRSIEFGYLDNRRNGVDILEDTVYDMNRTHFGQIKRKRSCFSARRVVGDWDVPGV